MDNFFSSATGPRGKFVKLKDKGDTITMEITDITTRPFVPYGENTPKRDKNGNEVIEALISGMDYAAETEEEASVVLPVNKFAMRQAIGKAVEDAGGSEPQAGGVLTVTCEGDGVALKPGAYPPKAFSATYQLPEPSETPWGQ